MYMTQSRSISCSQILCQVTTTQESQGEDTHTHTRGLRQDMELRDKKFPCEACPSAFKRAEHLTRHTRIHSKSKPFPCDACPKAFSRSDSLKRHYAGHDSVSWQDYKGKLDSLKVNSCFWAEYNAGRLSAYQLKTHIHSAACAAPQPSASSSSSSSSNSTSGLTATSPTDTTPATSLRLLAETCFSALENSTLGSRTDSLSSSSQQAAKKIRIEDLLNKSG